MEGCYCEWPEDKGNDWCYCLSCMECCEPCCGEPCNFIDGLYCFLSFGFFIFCAGPKCYSYAQNQDCHFVNHCLPFFLVLLLFIPFVNFILYPIIYFLFWTTFRSNLRKKHGIGEPNCGICDCCTGCICTSPCMACQEIRSVPREAWDWYLAYTENKYPTASSHEDCIIFCVKNDS
eukprot:TRINITY_DN172_c0_g2_i2.p1 TRINITY_DN172_c0_g2~~TRINITY_DN172_c0_g2_i2.p1  ORF type:complete len:176 (-),score=19.09 TRINITY_DN172_c0_g2_i2:146-673(-)